MSQSLTLGTSAIRTHDGLFSLNDLHKAAGNEKRHYPSYFLVNLQTKELVTELETTGIPVVKTIEGRNGGTYACKELVIAYAAWISAKFHLKVIRVFLASQAPTHAPATLPVAKPIDVHTLCQLILGGVFADRDFIELAYAVNQHQFKLACANTQRGYGEEVAQKIRSSMSWSDLHAINVAASMEVWMRSQTPTKTHQG